MIEHLDEVRGFMKELSPELGVTDPVPGDIVAYGAKSLQVLVRLTVVGYLMSY